MRYYFYVFVLSLVIFSSTCLAFEQAKVPFKIKQEVQYIFPLDTNINFTGDKTPSACGPRATVGGNGIPTIAFEDHSLRIFFSTESYFFAEMRNQEFHTEYSAKVSITRKLGKAVMSFVPVSKDYVFRKEETLLGFMKQLPYEVPFTEQDFLNLICSGSVSFKEEINSPYSPESIYANFQRKLKQRPLGTDPWVDPVTGKNYKFAYLLPYDQSETCLIVDAYPYRNGSKIVVHVIYIANPKSFTGNPESSVRQIDLSKAIADIRQEIKSIVED
ncbi:MAG: hypothetical protein HQL08_00715 [Nitrospirae bacterium]|nr:hypothetical protein [Nitrospirota bacterium]